MSGEASDSVSSASYYSKPRSPLKVTSESTSLRVSFAGRHHRCRPQTQMSPPGSPSAHLSRLGPFIITEVPITVGVARVHTPVGSTMNAGKLSRGGSSTQAFSPFHPISAQTHSIGSPTGRAPRRLDAAPAFRLETVGMALVGGC